MNYNILFGILSFLSISIINCDFVCNVKQGNIINKYPSEKNFKYAINFNTSIMQANYIYYIVKSGNNRCKTCNYFRNDPYGIDKLTNADYKYTNYDKGHIVPNSEYGNITFIISNVVPMVPRFNRGIWKNMEEYIRTIYKNKLVVKGCDYLYDDYIISNLGNKLYIPVGCYYIVFDINDLPDISTQIMGNVLDYGYYLNKHDSVKEKNLPYWASCHEIKKEIKMKIYNNPGSYILSPQDYGYMDSLIIEIWAAGGGGKTCFGNGGGSGSYIKGTIKPNNKTLNILVGIGGFGGFGTQCNNYYESINGLNGTESSITTSDKTINLTAGGGKSGKFLDNYGTIKSLIGAKIEKSVSGWNGFQGVGPTCGSPCQSGCTFPCDCNAKSGGNGGSSPNGGIGGTGIANYIKSPINGINGINGTAPGAGGGGFYNQAECCPTTGCHNLNKAGNGADGTVIIYYIN
jgi:DNA/RNA endonuclease G (NUC1)